MGLLPPEQECLHWSVIISTIVLFLLLGRMSRSVASSACCLGSAAQGLEEDERAGLGLRKAHSEGKQLSQGL